MVNGSVGYTKPPVYPIEKVGERNHLWILTINPNVQWDIQVVDCQVGETKLGELFKGKIIKEKLATKNTSCWLNQPS